MRRRRFTLADGMILIAALAIGLAMARAYDPLYTARDLPAFLKRGWGAPACVVAALAPALIALQARWKRRLPTRVLLRPGTIACCALLLAASIGIVIEVTHVVAASSLPRTPPLALFNGIWSSAFNLMPSAVVGAWVTLALTGRWRPARHWIDRAGRGVGLYWAGYLLLRTAASAVVWAFPFLA